MFRKVEPWVDLIEMETRILEFWQTSNAFDLLRQKNAGKPKWSFLDGPITANNPMGVHHAWGRTLKDVYQRYFAMTGHELRYQNGFDCQGLWVEVEVEKQLDFQSKRDIESFGIEKFIELCKERVLKFSKIQTNQSIRLGYWMDWQNSYYTMSDENNYMIWHFLKKCHSRGLIRKGLDVMPWCPRCGTGISQHEMQEGYKEVRDDSVVLRFPLVDRPNESLLVWTTTPWTLTSNVAAAVSPDLDYVRVKVNDQVFILAESRVPVVLNKSPLEILERMKGKALDGLRYHGPFDELPAQQRAREAHRVVVWDMVSSEEGTGIVHIAPGCGKEDYDLGMSLGLEAIAPIDEMGVFLDNFGWLTGQKAATAAQPIIQNLKEKGILLYSEKYLHSYPHCWRCSKPLLFRLVDEWYISMDVWRQEIMDVVNRITWIPDYGKDLELDWLRNMRDWMISKKRYWGLALPIWVCPDCGGFDVIGDEQELKARAVRGWEQFEGHSPHRPWIDQVLIRCPHCGGEARRITDVGNPWLDAGIVPYSTMGYRKDRAYWEQWFPPDLVLECFPGQFRNWFYSLLAMSTMLEGKEPFKTLLGHALVRDEHGNEMHKSTGNAIWFDDAVKIMGADVMRWIFCGHDPVRNLNFGYGAGEEVRGKFFNKLWNSYAFFANYARLVDFQPAQEVFPVLQRSQLDRWIISNLQIMIREARKAYEAFDVKAVVRAAEAFVEDLSNWYIRLSRRRFWRVKADADRRMAYQTLYECLMTLSKLLAPIIPFTMEEMYQNIGKTGADAPVSVHLLDFPEVVPDWIDATLSAEMNSTMKLTSLGLAAREKAGIRVRQPLRRLLVKTADPVEVQAATTYQEMLKASVNVREVVLLSAEETLPVAYSIKPNFRKLGPKFGAKVKDVAPQIAALDPGDLKKAFDAGDSFPLIVDGQQYELSRDDVDLEEKETSEYAAVEDGGTMVAVYTAMDDELALEGLMRDLLRNLQVLRKELGLEIEDRITLSYATESAKMAQILTTWQEFLSDELLCVSLSQQQPDESWKALTVRGEDLKVKIAKAGTE